MEENNKMANFTPSNNNQRKSVSVNTNGRRLTNLDGKIQSALDMVHWNSMLTLRFSPALPEGQRTETKFFSEEGVLQCALSADRLIHLSTGIIDKVLPAMDNGSDDQVVVPLGSDGVFGIYTRNVDGEQITYAMIAKGLDPKTRIPESYLMYQFKQTLVLSDYDHRNGDFATAANNKPELLILLAHMQESIKATTQAYVHAHRVVDRTFRESVLGALGVAGKGYSKGGGNNNTSSVFGSASTSGGSETTDDIAARNKLDNVESMKDFMDM